MRALWRVLYICEPFAEHCTYATPPASICHFAYIAPMTQRDAVALIDHPFLSAPLPRGGPSLASASAVTFTPTRWADLGCGSGTFTLALAELLPPGSTIEAIDLRPGIKPQTTAGGVTIIPRVADFVADDLALNGLDGILMANSLHYVRDKPALLQKLRAYYRGNDPASGAPHRVLRLRVGRLWVGRLWTRAPRPRAHSCSSSMIPTGPLLTGYPTR